MMRIHTLRRINFMLFDYKFNERLLSFARNIAAIIFLGGLALLIMFRAESKEDSEFYKILFLESAGWLVLLWSLYLACTNVAVLHHDFREYLKQQLIDRQLNHNSSHEELKSTSKITKILAKQSKSDALCYYLRYFFICLIGFAFTIIYLFGIVIIFLQQVRVFSLSN